MSISFELNYFGIGTSLAHAWYDFLTGPYSAQRKNVVSMREFWMRPRPQFEKNGGNFDDSVNKKKLRLNFIK